jgi:hypothetical protein
MGGQGGGAVPEEQLLDLDEIQVLGRGDGDAGRRVLVGEGFRCRDEFYESHRQKQASFLLGLC